jgi:invasion protein IalB
MQQLLIASWGIIQMRRRRKITAAMLGTLATIGCGGAVLAEDTKSDQQVTLVYAPWTKFCLKGAEANAKQVCFTGKDGRIESGQPVVAAVIIEPDGDPKKILRVTLPLGMQLAHGTRIVVDNRPPVQAPYVICFTNGCMSDYEATPDLIASMKKGQNLVVQAINSNGAPMTLALPLPEFARAYDGPPTDPKVFEAMQKKLQEELQQRSDASRKKLEATAGTTTVDSIVNKPVSNIAVAVAPPIANLVAPAGRRVALVVGNASYKFMPRLTNPINDATDVEKAFKDLGFETVLATDTDRSSMNVALDRFSKLVRGANVAVVYYSGHGMQFDGKNYLLPIDANLETLQDVNRFALLPVDDLSDVLSGANAGGLKLIVLDACRSNAAEQNFKNKVASVAGASRDVASTRGFARVTKSGLIIAYSTAPNEVASDGMGRNSPFTRAFLNDVGMPDTDIRQMLFRVQHDVAEASGQVPEISSLYTGPEVRLKTSQR